MRRRILGKAEFGALKSFLGKANEATGGRSEGRKGSRLKWRKKRNGAA